MAETDTSYNLLSSDAQAILKQLSLTNGDQYDPTNVGSTLFPMLFMVYVCSSKTENQSTSVKVSEKMKQQGFTNKKTKGTTVNDVNVASDAEKKVIIQGLRDWAEANAGTSNNLLSTYINTDGSITVKAKRYTEMFRSAVKKNDQYVWMLCNACTNLMSKFKARIPVSGGAYYQNSAKTSTSYWPILDSNDDSCFMNCMALLKLLFINGIIDYNFDLGIRSLNIQEGTLYVKEQYSNSILNKMRSAGKPIKGQFTVNPRSTAPQMYHTFAGTDITAIASVGNVVTNLEGLNQISWSIHSGKTSQKPLGKNNGGSRTSGTRTIAGTMVFTLFDHHPLLDLFPEDLAEFTNKSASSGKTRLYRPRYMPDQLPPFDLSIILMNEYGYCSMVSLYGIQVPDEGTVIGTDNLVTEIVCQYTAVSMDPIVQVEMDESGNIDPFGILTGGWSDFWKQREIVIAGVAYTDLEKAYESFYETSSS